MSIDKSKIAQAVKDGKITDEKTLAIFVMIEEAKQKVEDALKKIENSEVNAEKIFKSIKSIEGKQGERGEPGKDAYVPKKNVDYFDGEDGYTPIKGKDYFDGKPGEPGKNGLDGIVPSIEEVAIEAKKGILEALTPLIPKIQDIEKELPQLGEEIRDALELLTGDERLDISAIKGLSVELNKVKNSNGVIGNTARYFYQLYDVPQNYAGQSGKILKVKTTEDGIEFGTSSISGAALTKVDDTNITLTLGGSPTTALLDSTSLTLGWTGTLAKSRGGTASSDYTTATETFSNKRVVQRVSTVADATSISVNADNFDQVNQTNTQGAGTLTVNNPTGTPNDGDKLTYVIKSTNAQTLSFGASFVGSSDLSLPSSTTGSSKIDFFGFIYSTINSKFNFVASTKGF